MCHTADSLCSTSEINATLQRNYTPVKVNFKKKFEKEILNNLHRVR